MHDIIGEILLLLAATVLVVALFRRLHLPPILGYLFTGAILGPHALGLLEDGEVARFLGEIGIAFLLFIIGLEFSVPQFWRMRRILLGLGGAQVFIVTVVGSLFAWYLGISWPVVLIVGGALAMSSTAIVMKQLTEQGELHSPHGRLAVGILLFQDLAAVGFLAVIPILAAEGQSSNLDFLYALLRAVFALGVVLAVGRWLLKPLFQEVARSHSEELFTLTVLLVSLLAAWFTQQMGLSLVLGAFLAGMMLSETEYRHQIETELRPFRDILLGLFFITVGMQLNLTFFPALWPWVVVLLIGLVVGKGALIALLATFGKADKTTALCTGLVLAHGGEFGFALLALAIGKGLLLPEHSQEILVAIVVSMLLAPVFIRYCASISGYLFPGRSNEARQVAEIAAVLEESKPQNHIILCGYGRVGQMIASVLRLEGIPFVALDKAPDRIKEGWEDGDNVFYGDASRVGILHAAGISRAQAVVVTFNDTKSAVKIVANTRRHNKSIPILVRAKDKANLQLLLSAGATEVIPEAVEAGLALVKQLLLALELSEEEASKHILALRKENYKLF